jgi:ATP-dependent DNA ligase
LDKISRSRHIRGMTLPRVQPIIPTWRKEPFDNPDWLFDFKYDGFRALCYLQLGRASGFARDDPPAAKLEKLEALLARAAPPDEDVAFLADLLSLPASERHPLRNLSPQRRRSERWRR